MKQFRGLILKWREKSPVSFVLVKDGRIQKDVLALLGKTEAWAREFLEESTEVESIMLATVDESHKINILLKMKNIRILSFRTYDTIVWTTKRRRYGGICRRITKNSWSSPFNFSWCCCTHYK